MKKIILTAVFGLTLLLFAGCTPKATTNPVFENTKDVYGFEAISSLSLLSNVTTSQAEQKLTNTAYSNYLDLSANDVTEEEIDEINHYLELVEQMLSDDKPLDVITEISDREGFEHKMVITTKDLSLNTYTYVLYYNETPLNELEDDEDDEDKEIVEEENDDQETKDDDEIESSLEGILIVDDQEYTVFGKKEIEDDEMEVEFTSKIDDKNWVKVKQEIEDGESEFRYTISVDGVTSKTSIKVETNENETKVKLTFVEGKMVAKFQFKEEIEDGKRIIKIKSLDENKSINIKVYITTDPETGEVTYEYKYVETGESYFKGRNHDDNDKDDKRNTSF